MKLRPPQPKEATPSRWKLHRELGLLDRVLVCSRASPEVSSSQPRTPAAKRKQSSTDGRKEQ